MFKEGKWAKQILLQQRSDGGWGYFHSLARPQMGELTTEQALRRLSRLGFTMEDEPIARAVQYLEDCLLHRICTPDRVEKTHDWEIGTQMMFAAWIRHFKKENKHANHVAHCWAQVIHEAFISGEYSETHYLRGFLQMFGKPPKGPRLLDFVHFYVVSLIAEELDAPTESAVFDYILQKQSGIYYIYNHPLETLPANFASKQTSYYLATAEVLSAYPRSHAKMQFVIEWLEKNRNARGKWDLGAEANDGVYFPLSEHWRTNENREHDCTYRIEKLLSKLKL